MYHISLETESKTQRVSWKRMPAHDYSVRTEDGYLELVLFSEDDDVQRRIMVPLASVVYCDICCVDDGEPEGEESEVAS